MQKEHKKCTTSLMIWSQKLAQQTAQLTTRKSTTKPTTFRLKEHNFPDHFCTTTSQGKKHLIEIWQSKNIFSWKIASNKKASCQKNKHDYPQMPWNTPKSHEIYFLIDTIYARLCFDWSVRWEHCPQCEDVFASAEKKARSQFDWWWAAGLKLQCPTFRF